jgi:hypothetical protein
MLLLCEYCQQVGEILLLCKCCKNKKYYYYVFITAWMLSTDMKSIIVKMLPMGRKNTIRMWMLPMDRKINTNSMWMLPTSRRNNIIIWICPPG